MHIPDMHTCEISRLLAPHAWLPRMPLPYPHVCALPSGLPDEEGIPHQVAEAFQLNEVVVRVCFCVRACGVWHMIRSGLSMAAQARAITDPAHAQAVDEIQPRQAAS
jgi:hypothetical protein